MTNYVKEVDGKPVTWFRMEVVINATDGILPDFGLGAGVLIAREFSVFDNETPVKNANIMAEIGADLTRRAVVVRMKPIEIE